MRRRGSRRREHVRLRLGALFAEQVAPARRRLSCFPPGGDRVETFPSGIASKDSPAGEMRIVAKLADPAWSRPLRSAPNGRTFRRSCRQAATTRWRV